MNFRPIGRLRRWPGRVLRFAAARPAGVLLRCAVLVAVAGVVLLLAVLMAVAGVVLLLAVRRAADAGGAAAGPLALLLALLLSGLAFSVHRGVRAVRRRPRSRRADPSLQPTNPPIEEIAADLQRMLWRHDTFARPSAPPIPLGRVRALEIRITRRAVEAARALEVAHPDPPAYGGFDTAQLRRLLHDLTAEGLVLPPEVGLMAPDGRF
jgi:hypothetical protein